MTTYTKPPVKPAWGETNTSAADMVTPVDADIQTGWPLSDVPPSRQRWNWVLNWATNAIRYLMQRGLAAYDAAETYMIGARVIGDDGKTYRSIADNNINHTPSASAAQWELWGYTKPELGAVLQTSAYTSGADGGGVANTYTLTLSPVPAALVDRMVVDVKIAHLNTGASTLNLNALGAKAIVDRSYNALQGGELPLNGIARLQYNTSVGAGSWVLLSCTGALTVQMHGQCRLALSAGNLVLSPLDGNQLIVNGAVQRIPSAGVSLAPTALVAGTLYYIYAFMNAGVMTLEASTTTHVTDSTIGIEIKSGDATRTLVGMARPVAGPLFQDATNQRFVRSWFNRQFQNCFRNLQASRSTSSASAVETNSADRAEFLIWADETADVFMGGYASNSTVGTNNTWTIGLDGSTSGSQGTFMNQATANYAYPYGIAAEFSALGEGYHYVSTFFNTSAGTLTLPATAYIKVKAGV